MQGNKILKNTTKPIEIEPYKFAKFKEAPNVSYENAYVFKEYAKMLYQKNGFVVLALKAEKKG